MAEPNWSDPCAAATALRDAYFRLLSGSMEAEVEYRSNETTRRVTYARTDLEALRRAVERAEVKCAALAGAPPVRRTQVVRSVKGW